MHEVGKGYPPGENYLAAGIVLSKTGRKLTLRTPGTRAGQRFPGRVFPYCRLCQVNMDVFWVERYRFTRGDQLCHPERSRLHALRSAPLRMTASREEGERIKNENIRNPDSASKNLSNNRIGRPVGGRGFPPFRLTTPRTKTCPWGPRQGERMGHGGTGAG